MIKWGLMNMRKHWREAIIGTGIALLLCVTAEFERETVRMKNILDNVQAANVTYVRHSALNGNIITPRLTIREEVVNTVEEVEYTLTAYCGCEICCGEYAKNRPNGIVSGSAGVELVENYSVASPLPNGTKLLIDGFGEYVVHDKTAKWVADKYDDKIIDIYFKDHEDAKRFGKIIRKVSIIK